MNRAARERKAEFSRLEEWQNQILSRIERFSARDRLDRDELHRRAIRRHRRS